MSAISQALLASIGAVAAAATTITYIGTPTPDAGNLSAYTFAAANLGSGGGHVLVAVSVGDAASLTSVTVDGQATTAKVTNVNGTKMVVGLFLTDATVADATGDIVVTPGDAGSNCVVSIYRVDNLQSTTATDTDFTDTDNTGIGLTVAAGGVFVAVAGIATSGTFTWTNATEDYDTTTEYGRSSASGSSVGGGTVTITADATAATNFAAAFVSLR